MIAVAKSNQDARQHSATGRAGPQQLEYQRRAKGGSQAVPGRQHEFEDDPYILGCKQRCDDTYQQHAKPIDP